MSHETETKELITHLADSFSVPRPHMVEFVRWFWLTWLYPQEQLMPSPRIAAIFRALWSRPENRVHHNALARWVGASAQTDKGSFPYRWLPDLKYYSDDYRTFTTHPQFLRTCALYKTHFGPALDPETWSAPYK